MKLSLCNEVLRTLDLPAQCAFARTVGYDGLEIAPFTLSDEPHRIPAARRAEIRRVVEDHGLTVTGLHYLMLAPAGLSITSGDAAVRALTLEVVEALCELCADLGGSYLVHGSPAQRSVSDEADRERGVAFFQRAGGFARQAGVTYLVEPLDARQTNFVNTVAEAAAILRALDEPGLATMLDCSAGSVAEAEPLDAVLDTWLPTGLLKHIQVNDPNRRGPGEGALKLAPVVAALKRNGYAGTVAVEPFDYRPDGQACAARAAGYMRALFEAVP